MPIINPWTVIAAGKAVWNGYKWVKKMKKLKKGGGSTVKKIQSGTKPKNKAKSMTGYRQDPKIKEDYKENWRK